MLLPPTISNEPEWLLVQRRNEELRKIRRRAGTLTFGAFIVLGMGGMLLRTVAPPPVAMLIVMLPAAIGSGILWQKAKAKSLIQSFGFRLMLWAGGICLACAWVIFTN